MREVASLTTTGLDRLFGESLWSVQFVSVSACLSAATTLFTVLSGIEGRFLQSELSDRLRYSLFLVAAALLPLIWRRLVWITLLSGIWGLLTVGALQIGQQAFVSQMPFSFGGHLSNVIAIAYLFIIPVGIATDTLAVATGRRALRNTSYTSQVAILKVALRVALIPAVLVCGPLILSVSIRWASRLYAVGVVRQADVLGVAELLRWFAYANIFSSCAAIMYLFLSVLMLVHRALWPLFLEHLYGLAGPYRLFDHRKALIVGGLTMVGAGWHLEALRKIAVLIKELL